MKKTLIMSFRPKRRNLLGIKSKLYIKKKIYAICAGFITLNLQLLTHNSLSQNVGVNDNGASPNANAILDVDASSNDKGLLIPRITTTQRTGISGLGAGDEGLSVYDETTTSFWFWDGTQWVEMAQVGASWELLGNAGTTNGTHFIGTTDAQDLDIRANNSIKVRITQQGQIEVLNTGQSVFIGQGAGANDDLTTNANVYVGYTSGNANVSGRYNTGVGDRTLTQNTGNANTAVGRQALTLNTTGSENTALGRGAMGANTTGNDNTATGRNALALNTVGFRNVANGFYALYSNVAGSRGTAIGHNAMYYANSSATSFTNYNVAVGYEALRGSTTAASNTGNQNTAVGYQSLYSNTSGGENTAMGYLSLNSNTIAQGNTALGYAALENMGSIGGNTAVGSYALRNATSGPNTAVGRKALELNTSGSANTGIGYLSLQNNTSGQFNTALGSQAMQSNTTANENTSLGYGALNANTTGAFNTAVGSQSAISLNGGIRNTASGYLSLRFNTAGNDNTAIGTRALESNLTGSSNTALGYLSGLGAASVNFTQCTFLGANSSPTVARTNVTMIGYGVTNAECTGNNEVCIGNTAITAIKGQVAFTTYSDARYKVNVEENIAGLDFITKLRPVTYNVRPKELHKIWETPDSLLKDINFTDAEQQKRIGFLAQEVEQAAKESGFTFPGIDLPRNEKEVYSLRYVDFIMPIVKSVQELNKNDQLTREELLTKIEALEANNNSQEQEIVTLKKKLEQQKIEVDTRLQLLEEHLKTAVK